MIMKMHHWIYVFVVTLVMITATGGLVGLKSEGSAQNLTVENEIPSVATPDALNTVEQYNQDDQGRSIFSKTTIISLLVAVMGIVAFRRNTYS